MSQEANEYRGLGVSPSGANTIAPALATEERHPEGDILKQRSQLNRHLYHQRITDAAEAQAELALPTAYTGFDADLGLAKLQDGNGDVFYGNAQTNGAIALGENIRLRRGGVFAKYDSMPRRKPALTPSDKPLKPSKGFLFFLDKDILNINGVENEADNILTFTAIFKYFTTNKKNIYTLKDDGSRFNVSSGLIPQDGIMPSTVLSKVVENMNLKVIEIDLSKTSQIETFLYLPFPSYDYPRTGDFSNFFTDTEKSNLKKIAASSGLIAVGDVFYETYHSYLLNIFKLNKRITTITPPIEPIGFYLNSNTSILNNYIKNNRLAYDATAIFQGARKSEIVMMASGKPSMILITNL